MTLLNLKAGLNFNKVKIRIFYFKMTICFAFCSSSEIFPLCLFFLVDFINSNLDSKLNLCIWSFLPAIHLLNEYLSNTFQLSGFGQNSYWTPRGFTGRKFTVIIWRYSEIGCTFFVHALLSFSDMSDPWWPHGLTSSSVHEHWSQLSFSLPGLCLT